jgi:hypothetical protein
VIGIQSRVGLGDQATQRVSLDQGMQGGGVVDLEMAGVVHEDLLQ